MTRLKIEAIAVFDSPIQGSDLPKVVSLFLDDHLRMIARDERHPDRLLVGMGSEHRSEHVLISDPNSTIDGVLEDAWYDEVIVKRYRWPGVFKIELDDYAQSLRAVLDFTRGLQQLAYQYNLSKVS